MRGLRFRFVPFLLGLFTALGTSAASDPENPAVTDLFQKGKREFKLASYRSSLMTFEELERVSLLPGHERDRVELEPVIAFYRGANLAALGQAEPAKKEFQKYLAFSPNTRLDPSLYPKAVIAALDRARQELGKTSSRGQSTDYLAAEYARFAPMGEAPAAPLDERWAGQAVRYLMTEAEKAAWSGISDPVERAGFIASFWQKRDPNPATPENEFRIEFEKRVLFADAHFRDGEKKGSETDRGLVFVLLGSPSYTRLLLLQIQDDLSQAARTAPWKEAVLNPSGSVTLRTVPGQSLGAEPGQGRREVWYYKRDRLPRSLRYAEVAFEFVTKQSYGTAVLQREPTVLATLERAVKDAISSPN